MATTELNNFPFPDEREEPFFEAFREGETQRDLSHYALADDHNLIFSGGGTVSWTLSSEELTWTDTIKVTTYATGPRFATIPAATFKLEDGEVLFFTMPRLMQADQGVSLVRTGRVFTREARLHDRRILAARIGDIVYLPGGHSLKDGDSGSLFDSGLASGSGLTSLAEGDGIDVTNPGGPTPTIEVEYAGSGGSFGTSAQPARSDHTHALAGHTHEDELYLSPGAGTTLLNLDDDGNITGDNLIWVAIYRNGVRLRQGIDYTVDLGAQTATLSSATKSTDAFVIDRITT